MASYRLAPDIVRFFGVRFPRVGVRSLSGWLSKGLCFSFRAPRFARRCLGDRGSASNCLKTHSSATTSAAAAEREVRQASPAPQSRTSRSRAGGQSKIKPNPRQTLAPCQFVQGFSKARIPTLRPQGALWISAFSFTPCTVRFLFGKTFWGPAETQRSGVCGSGGARQRAQF